MVDYAELRSKSAPWAPDTRDEWIQDCVARCLEPTGLRGKDDPTGTHYFLMTFFPKLIEKEMTPERFEYLKLLDDDRIPNLYMLTHRGFGKTTLGLGAVARMLVCRLQKYVLYTSSIYDVAARRTEAIKSLVMSPQIQAVFGHMKPESGAIIGSQFSKEAFMLVNPDNGRPLAFVEPKGAEQVCNGSLVMLDGEAVRPTMILSDDGQKRLHIGNETVRKSYEEWWSAELEPTVQVDAEPDPKTHMWKPTDDPMWRPPFRKVVTDTCKHVAAHIMQLTTSPHWVGRSFPLAEEVDGKYVLRHKIMSQAKLTARYDKFARRGELDEFCREYCCRPSANLNRSWNTGMYRYFDQKDFSGSFGAIIVDPARGAGFTSILGFSVLPSEGIFLRKNIVANLQPEDMYQACFDMANELKIDLIIVEETGLAAIIKNAFHQAASIRGLQGHIRFDWLKSQRAPGVDYGTGPQAIKVARGGATIPLYREGLVWHHESLRGSGLERAQLIYPDCTLWDAMDTQGYIPEVMERYEIYLDPKPGREMQMNDDIDDDYEECGRWSRNREWCS